MQDNSMVSVRQLIERRDKICMEIRQLNLFKEQLTELLKYNNTPALKRDYMNITARIADLNKEKNYIARKLQRMTRGKIR